MSWICGHGWKRSKPHRIAQQQRDNPMSKTLEFFFDVGSPTTYLAWTQLPKIAAAAGVEITWKPMLLGGVFKATNNHSPIEVPAKATYTIADMQRFAVRYGVPLAFNPFFPINTLTLMRGAAGYLGTERFHPYLQAIFTALWVDKKNLGDPQVLGQVLTDAGFDAQEFMALVSDDGVKQRLKDLTEEAISRGAFGAPIFFVNGEMHFGQDRLDFVAEALQRP
jgi:2-hydroxychromene-2-carboxylate isomerase